ncbi:hypothetical protein HJD18_03295 [Thermoleophilia bacterium SCSIO 60948]|nr:hypothetical protein HJD18_03295 [Thermoleophilia bacterium SCSIO 60948]
MKAAPATAAPPPRDEGRAPLRLRDRTTLVPIAIWAAVIFAGWIVGTILNDQGESILLDSPPLYGNWDVRFGLGSLWPIAVGVLAVWLWPRVIERASWRGVIWTAFAFALAWPVSLALVEGVGELTEPLLWFTQYQQAVPFVGDPLEFIRDFNTVVNGYPAHVTAHPPLAVLAYWLVEQVVPGVWGATVLTLVSAATAPIAALVAARRLTDEATARRAAPYLVIGPAALAIATTADAMFMAVVAWSVCALVVALTGEPGRRADVLSLLGGLGFGIAIFMSFGLILAGAIPLAVAIQKRRIKPILLAAVGGLLVIGAFLAAGYWWLDGLDVVGEQYADSVASTRPYWYFVWNNLAAFALGSLGPALAIALWRFRDKRLAWVVGGAFAAIAIADISGMSKAEVERIWLPFLPWILLAAVALPSDPRSMRWLVGAQAVTTFVIATYVWTIW